MQLYRYKIRPLSPFATPMRSDTLCGQMLWAAAELWGEARVKELIGAFEGTEPPFKLSSAFPRGFLPMPVLPPGKARERGRESFEEFKRSKRLRKLSWLPVSEWKKLVKEGVSRERVFRVLGEMPQEALQPEELWWNQPHVTIDRRTGTVRSEGGLYFTPCLAPGEDRSLEGAGQARYREQPVGERAGEWELYVETGEKGLVEELLGHVAMVGFGAKASVGMGRFEFEEDENFVPEEVQGEGEWMLSLSVVASSSPWRLQGYWKTEVKAPKAWAGFRRIEPFKRPIVIIKEGAVFARLPQEGFVIRNIHPKDKEIVQVCWPVTLRFNLLEAEA